MNISDTDLAPVGGGDLRGPSAPSTSKAAGTFTPTASPDPDDIWNPRGRDVGMNDTSTRYDPYRRSGAESERRARREHVGGDYPFNVAEVAGNIRAAVRPGIAG